MQLNISYFYDKLMVNTIDIYSNWYDFSTSHYIIWKPSTMLYDLIV